MGYAISRTIFFNFILYILTFFCLNTVGIFEINLPNFFKNNNLYNLGSNFLLKIFLMDFLLLY